MNSEKFSHNGNRIMTQPTFVYENWIYTAVVQQTTLKVGNNANHLFEYFKFNSAPCSFARDYYYFRVRNITDHDFADSDNRVFSKI